MRLILLSRNASLYSTSRLARAARARDHRMDVVDPLDLQLALVDGRSSIRYRGRPLPAYDVVLPRIGTSVTRYGLSVVQGLESGGASALNGAESIALSRDKIGSLERLALAGIPVPATVCIRSADGVEEALELVGGCPVVVKLQQGTQGVGTMLAESKRALLPLVDTMMAMGHEVILQHYVKESRGRDLRVFVVGRRVVAAMRRSAPGGEFRANLHRGARGEAVALDPVRRRMALRAARALDLDIAGVDILESRDGPLVIEVNSSPGLEGIEQITGVDIAGAVIAFAERRLAKDGRPSRSMALADDGTKGDGPRSRGRRAQR
jgi:ribosomal protein S6--L-glutamate ligase